jgi:hypothetical protein
VRSGSDSRMSPGSGPGSDTESVRSGSLSGPASCSSPHTFSDDSDVEGERQAHRDRERDCLGVGGGGGGGWNRDRGGGVSLRVSQYEVEAALLG